MTDGENATIYILKTCDAWRTYDSMREVCVSTSQSRIEEVARTMVRPSDLEADGLTIEDVTFDNLCNQRIDGLHLDTYDEGELL